MNFCPPVKSVNNPCMYRDSNVPMTATAIPETKTRKTTRWFGIIPFTASLRLVFT